MSHGQPAKREIQVQGVVAVITNANIQAAFPIAPDRFWALFSAKLRDRWRAGMQDSYSDRKRWTENLTTLVEELAGEFDCYSDDPWFQFDVAYYAKDAADNPWWGEWAVEAAIELENDNSWTHELNKLMLVNAGLKVLVAYEDQPMKPEFQNEFLKFHASRKYHTMNCGWLLIFGPMKRQN